MRVDLWLFQARLFKSRTQATNACKEGKVVRNEKKLEPSDSVQIGDVIQIRDRGLYRTYRILEFPGKNVSKEVAKTTYRDETAEEIVQKFLELKMADKLPRPTGTKPTKKERRQIQKLKRKI
ncbi:MAG: S4 domain-containing protein [bacterium]|nr:S4 domain-containing protein [bacterium]